MSRQYRINDSYRPPKPPRPPQTGRGRSELREYIPESWFHERGRHKVLKRLTPRLPNVSGKLFLTFTVDPAHYSCPEAAFDHSRDRLCRIFHRLRRGVTWEGKAYKIDSPYAIKHELHKGGWAHYHAIFLTRSYLPKELLNHLWGLGFTHVRRISSHKFRYLLKYVTKSGTLPDWVLDRNRLRIFQSSKGFLAPVERAPQTAKDDQSDEEGPKRPPTTIGQRIELWKRKAILRTGERYRTLPLKRPFAELLNEMIYAIALERRYLGNGAILISGGNQLTPWIKKQ